MKDNMMGFATLLVTVLPMELIIERLEKSIQDYKENPTDKNKQALLFYTVQINIKLMTDAGNPKDSLNNAMDFVREMDNACEWDRLNPNKKINQS